MQEQAWFRWSTLTFTLRMRANRKTNFHFIREMKMFVSDRDLLQNILEKKRIHIGRENIKVRSLYIVDLYLIRFQKRVNVYKEMLILLLHLASYVFQNKHINISVRKVFKWYCCMFVHLFSALCIKCFQYNKLIFIKLNESKQ